MPEKKKRVLKAGYKRVVKNKRAYYVSEKTGHRVLKSTATRAAGAKRRTVHRKKRVARRH